MNKALSYPCLVLLSVTVMVALAGLCSCQKEEGMTSEISRIPIRFSCVPVEVTTKADASYIKDETIPQDQHFAVYAWDTGSSFLTDNPVAASGSPSFMSALNVTFQNNDDKGKNNTYPGDYYWPLPEAGAYNYSFLAYYPLADGSGITAPVFSSGNVGSYAFTAKDNASAMVDFCVSDVANDVIYGNGYTYSSFPGTVGLTFHHTLTRVRFKFIKAKDVDDDTHIYIDDIKLLNVRKRGTLTVGYAQPDAPGHGHPGTTSFTWSTDPDSYKPSPSEPQVPYELTINGEDPVPDTNPVELMKDAETTVSDSEVFLMIPQKIWKTDEPEGDPSPQKISLIWRVGDDVQPNAILTLDECVKAVGSHENAGISEWRPNMSVLYTIVIKAKPIEFSIVATIEEWRDENGYVSIIP